MNSFLTMCIVSLALVYSEKPVEAFYKTNGVLVAVDSIEYVEATYYGSVIHMESGSRIYTEKSWDALVKLINGTNREFIVVYQKNFPAIRKDWKNGKTDKIQGTLK